MRQGRVTLEELEERLADTEQHMVRVRNKPRIRTMLCAKYGVDQRTVRNWIKKVEERWDQESTGRIRSRSETAATFNEIIAASMTKMAVVYEKDGAPARFPPGHPQAGNIVMRPNPDMKSALDALRQMRAMLGLDIPTKSTVTVQDGDRVRQLDVVTTAAERKELEAALKGGIVGRVSKPVIIDAESTEKP